MARLCGKCGNDIKEIEPARCSLCEKYFHVKQDCSDVTRSNIQQLFNVNKALWLCMDCREVFGKHTLRSFIMEKERNNGGGSSSSKQADVVSTLRQQVAELTAFVTTLQSVVKTNHEAVLNKLDKINTAGPAAKDDDDDEFTTGRKRRRRNQKDDPASVAVAHLPKSCGTNNSDFSALSLSCSIVNFTPPDDRFYVYLGGLNPKITDDDVVKIAQFCLNTTDDVRVGRLVPKNADISKYTFVSFKVGVDPSLKEAALQMSTWPVGIQVRKFVDDSSKNQPAGSTITSDDPSIVDNEMDQN